MPPVWLCLECEGIAYGWATGPCIHCGSSRVLAAHRPAGVGEETSDYRLLYLPLEQWNDLKAEAEKADLSPQDLLAEREAAEVVLIREEPIRNARLALLKG